MLSKKSVLVLIFFFYIFYWDYELEKKETHVEKASIYDRSSSMGCDSNEVQCMYDGNFRCFRLKKETNYFDLYTISSPKFHVTKWLIAWVDLSRFCFV